MYDRTETELMRISPMDTLSVQMLVDEMDILSVHTGQEAEITVDAAPGRAFTGTVTAIDPNGKNNGGNSKYTVTITMPRAEHARRHERHGGAHRRHDGKRSLAPAEGSRSRASKRSYTPASTPRPAS